MRSKLMLLLLITLMFVGITACGSEKTSHMDTDPGQIYLGDKNAKNEIVFVFDYFCPYCSVWLEEMYGEVDKLIDSGEVRFRTQPMTYLGDPSIELAKVDQNIKVNYQDKYFDISFKILNEIYKNEGASDINSLISEIVNDYELDLDLLTKEPSVNVVDITEKITKEYDLEFVPVVIVNGEVIEDSFDINAIKGQLE